MSKRKSTPEGAVLKQILDWLAAKHILAFRMQVGAFPLENAGKKRFMKVGTPGMADILAFPIGQDKAFYDFGHCVPMWIETKSLVGKQTPLQKSFQKQVEDEGHLYVVARDVSDVERVLP